MQSATRVSLPVAHPRPRNISWPAAMINAGRPVLGRPVMWGLMPSSLRSILAASQSRAGEKAMTSMGYSAVASPAHPDP